MRVDCPACGVPITVRLYDFQGLTVYLTDHDCFREEQEVEELERIYKMEASH